jgi:hypothetical protein
MAVINRRVHVIAISDTIMKYRNLGERQHTNNLYELTFKLAGKCTNPQFQSRQELWTRCQKCKACLRNKSEIWIQRSIKERSKWDRAWFVTLTYSNTTEYNYENVQNWLKSIRERRKTNGKSNRISYICTDEYDSKGERDHHPHHHLVVYGGPDLTYRDMAKGQNANHWRHGHSHIELLKSHSAAYVAKYINKTGNRIRASQDFGIHTTKHLIA